MQGTMTEIDVYVCGFGGFWSEGIGWRLRLMMAGLLLSLMAGHFWISFSGNVIFNGTPYDGRRWGDHWSLIYQQCWPIPGVGDRCMVLAVQR